MGGWDKEEDLMGSSRRLRSSGLKEGEALRQEGDEGESWKRKGPRGSGGSWES